VLARAFAITARQRKLQTYAFTVNAALNFATMGTRHGDAGGGQEYPAGNSSRGLLTAVIEFPAWIDERSSGLSL
jgi:hypothetical protein